MSLFASHVFLISIQITIIPKDWQHFITIKFAGELLNTVKYLASTSETKDNFAAYTAQQHAESLCVKVLQGILGNPGYTLLLTGVYESVHLELDADNQLDNRILP